MRVYRQRASIDDYMAEWPSLAADSALKVAIAVGLVSLNLALQFEAHGATTTIEDIEVLVGRTGKLMPLLLFNRPPTTIW